MKHNTYTIEAVLYFSDIAVSNTNPTEVILVTSRFVGNGRQLAQGVHTCELASRYHN